MPIALVTGATGCLGQALCADLAREGWTIRSLSRRPAPPETPVARHYALDLGSDPLPEDALQGVDTVFHCAALSSAWGAAAEFHAANVTATERLLAAARRAGTRRFVFASTPSIYINGRPRENLAEDAPLPRRFLTEYARTKFIAETLVRAANGADFTTVALRPRAIYGPHDRALLPRLLKALGDADDSRPLTLPGNGTALIDPTHASDAAQATRLAALADAATVGGRAYNITSGQSVTVNELLDRLAPIVGRTVSRRFMPYAAAATAASLTERLQRLRDPGQEPRLTRHAVAALGLTLTLDISAARRDLGYVPRVSLEEGLSGLSGPSTGPRPVPVPAQPRDNAIRLEMLRVGDCVSPGMALRRDAAPVPRVVPALVAVLDHGNEVSLFDTGYGRSWSRITRRLPEFAYRLAVPSRIPAGQQLDVSLRRLGVGPVSRVIFSHLHADHVTGLFDLDPMPPCLASREALAKLARIAPGKGAAGRVAALFEALPVALARQLQGLVTDGRLTEIEAAPTCALPPALAGFGPGHDLRGDGSMISVALPGHGNGQIGLWLPRSSRGPVLLAADAAFSGAALRDGVLPPAAILARLGDPVAYRRTFEALGRLASEGIEIIVSHDPHVRTS